MTMDHYAVKFSLAGTAFLVKFSQNGKGSVLVTAKDKQIEFSHPDLSKEFSEPANLHYRTKYAGV